MAAVQRSVVAFSATARLASIVRNGAGVIRHRSYVILNHVAATVPAEQRRSLQLLDRRGSDCLRLSFCSTAVPATGDRRSCGLRVLAEATSPAVAVDKVKLTFLETLAKTFRLNLESLRRVFFTSDEAENLIGKNSIGMCSENYLLRQDVERIL